MPINSNIARLATETLVPVFDRAFEGATRAYYDATTYDMQSMNEFGYVGWYRAKTYLQRQYERGELEHFEIRNQNACLLQRGRYFLHFHRVGRTKDADIQESTPQSAAIKLPGLDFEGITLDLFAKEVPTKENAVEYIVCLMASPEAGGLDACYLAEPAETDSNGVPQEWNNSELIWKSNHRDIETPDYESDFEIEQDFDVNVGLSDNPNEADQEDESGDNADNEWAGGVDSRPENLIGHQPEVERDETAQEDTAKDEGHEPPVGQDEPSEDETA